MCWVFKRICRLLGIQTYLPSALFAEAELLSKPSATLWQTLIVTLLSILVFMGIMLIRLKKLEWNERH